MAARKLIYHLMVLSPAMLLSSIAIESRIGYAGFDEPPVLPDTQQRITAYIDVVRLTDQVIGDGFQPSPAQVRDLAQVWIYGAQSGRLQALLPQHAEDSPREGARGQVFEARAKVLGSLQSLARSGLNRKNYLQAARDAMLAVHVAETMKYSELYLVGASSTEQRAALAQIERAIPHLSASEAEGLRAESREILRAQAPIDRLIQLNRQQFQSMPPRRGIPPLSSQEVQQLAVIDTMVREDASPKLVMREIRNSLAESKFGGMPLYLSGIKLGIQAQEQLRTRLAAIAHPQEKRPSTGDGL